MLLHSRRQSRKDGDGNGCVAAPARIGDGVEVAEKALEDFGEIRASLSAGLDVAGAEGWWTADADLGAATTEVVEVFEKDAHAVAQREGFFDIVGELGESVEDFVELFDCVADAAAFAGDEEGLDIVLVVVVADDAVDAVLLALDAGFEDAAGRLNRRRFRGRLQRGLQGAGRCCHILHFRILGTKQEGGAGRRRGRDPSG